MTTSIARALVLAAGTLLGAAAMHAQNACRRFPHCEQGMQQPEGEDIFGFAN